MINRNVTDKSDEFLRARTAPVVQLNGREFFPWLEYFVMQRSILIRFRNVKNAVNASIHSLSCLATS
jgi:hypothetical protein